ncbi:MAG TPA: MMPL family transporter [Thermomicrobiales bacterium]|nr:MMPL family transporter [Thermomicrobiales bacterium]
MLIPSTSKLSAISARHPWRTLGIWVVLLVLGAMAAGMFLSDGLTTKIEMLNNPESTQGTDLLDARMGDTSPLTETIVLTSGSLTVDEPEFKQVADGVFAELAKMPELVDQDPAKTVNYYLAAEAPDPAVQNQSKALVSEDGSTLLIPVTLIGDEDETSDRAQAYIDAIDGQSTDAVKVSSIGDMTTGHEFSTISEEDLVRAEIVGVPIALIVLMIVFGAVVAALVPIGMALAAVAIATGIAALIGTQFELSFFITNMISVIGLAVGIDYALFVIERYREERRHGRSKPEAIEVAGGTATKAVVFSGLTVVFALIGLFLMPTSIFRSLGLGAILAVLVSVGAIMTLIPAMIGLLGDRIDWPRRRNYDAMNHEKVIASEMSEQQHGFWGRAAHLVMARPWPALVIGAGILLLLAYPFFSMKTGFAGAESLPEGDVKDAFVVLQDKFTTGRLAPVEIVIDGNQANAADATASLAESLANDPAISSVEPVQWNEAGDLGLIRATLTTSPNDEASFTEIRRLRSDVIPNAFPEEAGRVLVTGQSAGNVDFIDLTDTWTPRVFLFVLGLSFLLLMVAFRSIVVPATAIVMNLLSVGAAYGVLVLVFQRGHLTGLLGFDRTPVIEAWIPIFLFCVLFGLSMDYQVFLLSRIREFYDATGNNRESVAHGVESTARIITGAALIMVVVFLGFSTGRLVFLQQVGFGLAVAILLDATIVRTILVPAVMRLLGDWNWYLPKWLEWLPDLRIEGTPRPATGTSGQPAGVEGQPAGAGD